MRPYTLFVQNEVMNRLLQTSSARRRPLLAFFEKFAANPYQEGEFQVRDTHDRPAEVTRVGRWLVTYCADHAVCEVQVLDLQPL